MNESAPQEHHHRNWAVALTCTALVLLIFVGGLIALRDQMLKTAREEVRQQTLEREKLASRIDTLQSSLDTLSSQSKPENAAGLHDLTAKLAETTDTLTALGNRVETLEKKLSEAKPEAALVPPPPPAPVPAPAAPAPTPIISAPMAEIAALKAAVLSGKPYADALDGYAKTHPEQTNQLAPLTGFAASGLPSEADLMRQLNELLDAKQQPATVDDTSLVGKINTHLKGLVSIKKTSQDDPLAALRKQAAHEDLPTVAHEIARLDMPAESPLGQWLEKARARRDALAALDTLGTPMAEQ